MAVSRREKINAKLTESVYILKLLNKTYVSFGRSSWSDSMPEVELFSLGLEIWGFWTVGFDLLNQPRTVDIILENKFGFPATALAWKMSKMLSTNFNFSFSLQIYHEHDQNNCTNFHSALFLHNDHHRVFVSRIYSTKYRQKRVILSF